MSDPAAAEPQGCRFCAIPETKVIASNALAFAIRDAFPVTPLHTLVMPLRHVVDYFGLTAGEREACAELVQRLRDDILQQDPSVEGFNLGTNAGEVAGQTIFHCHFHLMPRRRGDIPDPRGGVRMVIPHKGNQKLDVCPFTQETV
jgi:diadenosine tetraphosphate (Ap4A) HIT family hydrolase